MKNSDSEKRYEFGEKPGPVVSDGEFCFAAIGLNHGHIYGMCRGLLEAGATLKWVYDKDDAKVEKFRQSYPQARQASSVEEILEDPRVRLVAGCEIPYLRCALGIRVMEAGKDYFCDKAPMTTLEQLQQAQEAVKRTGRKYMVYFSERLHVEAAVFAGRLIEEGAIGRVFQVTGFGPHRLGSEPRPDWFYDQEKYGGILCDIGSHQIEQFLFYTGARDARVVRSQVANYAHPEHPDMADFGDCQLVADNGASQYFRVDWFTPDGLRNWGDGRTFILGTKGYLELRKYINIAEEPRVDNCVYLVNGEGEFRFDAAGKVGHPFFGQLILDCINRTENAMTQEHAFKAAELSIKAQMQAENIFPV